MGKRISKTELVKIKLVNQLKNGGYREGDALSSVEQLAKQLSVSKNTVSMVLSQLNDENVITMSHGKVTRVTDRVLRPHVVLFSGIPYNMELHEFWGDFYLGVKEIFDADGRVSYDTYASSLLFSNKLELRYLPPRVDAFILFGTSARHEIDNILAQGCPVVNLYEIFTPGAPRLPEVAVSFEEPFRALAEQFSRSGVRTCGYAGYLGELCFPDAFGCLNMTKFNVFCKMMKEKNIDVPQKMILETGCRLRNGYNVIYELSDRLAGEKFPDALFLTTDILAPGAYKALRELGLRIPEDIQVAGCDGMEIGNFVEPELTTIDPNRMELGRIAARKILSAIFENKPVERFIPEAKLILRNSILKGETKK